MIAITLATFVESTIIYYCDSPIDSTPFSSPFIAALFCGILYPIYNLPIIIVLYKYKFTIIEIVVESVCFVNITSNIENVIEFFVPSSQLWNHKIIDGIDVCERVWWYNSSLNIVYGICLTLLLCLLYIKVKPSIKGSE